MKMGFFSNLFKKKDKKEAEAECAEAKAAPAKKECACENKKDAFSNIEVAKPAADAAATAAPVNQGHVEYPAADLGELLPAEPSGGKINLAIYWAAACGGCDVSLLDTNERVLTIGQFANIVMWPIASDGKEKDIAAMNDGDITVSIISGAVRNTENEHMVKLLRQKSKIVVCYGTCAMFGGSPALANLVNGGSQEILDYVYTKTPSSASFQADYHKDAPVIPQSEYQAPEGTLTLPVLYDTVKTLDQVIDVDYYIPGCPPLQESISHLLKAVIDFVYNGVALPPKGTEIGVTEKCLCDECPREKAYARITKIYEPYQVDVDPNKCLMDQGILCLGPATVGGCNAKCTRAGQPCRGCYGPTHFVEDHGSSAFSAIASLFPVLDEDPTCDEEKIIEVMSTIKDPLGYFYAFTLGKSLINRSVSEEKTA